MLIQHNRQDRLDVTERSGLQADTQHAAQRATHGFAAGETVQTNRPARRNEPANPAKAGRDPDRAHDVVANIHVADAQSDGAGAASAAPAACTLRETGMVRPAVNRVVCLDIHGGGGHVGLAENQRTRLSEPGHGLAV